MNYNTSATDCYDLPQLKKQYGRLPAAVFLAVTRLRFRRFRRVALSSAAAPGRICGNYHGVRLPDKDAAAARHTVGYDCAGAVRRRWAGRLGGGDCSFAKPISAVRAGLQRQ
jgi:hypothetical protein